MKSIAILVEVLILLVVFAIAPLSDHPQAYAENTENESEPHIGITNSAEGLTAGTCTYSSAIELTPIRTSVTPSKKELEISATKAAAGLIKESIQLEPILKSIVDNDYQPAFKTLTIESTRQSYKLPPDIGQTVLVNIFVSGTSVDSLRGELELLGAEIYSYFENEQSIKARIDLDKIRNAASLEGVIDIRRVINFPLSTEDYNIRTENGNHYYKVFLNTIEDLPNDSVISALEEIGVLIKKQYNDGVIDFTVCIPTGKLSQVAELSFVTYIEYCSPIHQLRELRGHPT